MNKLIAVAVCIGAVITTGCASVEVPANTAKIVAQTKVDDDKMTGSRINRTATDRNVKGVGNSTFKQDNEIRSIANEPGMMRGSN